MSHLTSGNLHLSSLALTTIGWILQGVSMGKVDWRVWHLDNTTSIISSRMACVGIWKVCSYNSILVSPQGRYTNICHTYGMYNTFLPKDFQAIQNILLFACILGAIGKASIIIALRNLYLGVARKPTTWKTFTIGGFFYTSAGICILICVIWNFKSVFKNESITFPATFYIPPRPKTQEIGSAVPIAIVSAILMLLGGFFFLSYKFHMNNQIHPVITDKMWTSAPEI